MFPLLLGAIVPLLVKVAEKTIVGEKTGPLKQKWVVDFVDELFSMLEEKFPKLKILMPARDTLESMVCDAIEKALEKLGWKHVS